MRSLVFVLTFILTSSAAFSAAPVQSIACDSTMDKEQKSHCHKTESEKQATEKSHHSDCQMTCCHYSLLSTPVVEFKIYNPKIQKLSYIWKDSKLRSNPISIFRPPIFS